MQNVSTRDIVAWNSTETQCGTHLKVPVKDENVIDFDDTGFEKHKVDKPVTFGEDLYSLLFVSLVRPQYKIYCDLVAKTG